jgi:hypothetical protein
VGHARDVPEPEVTPAANQRRILRIEELRQVIDSALDRAEQRFGPAVDVTAVPHVADYYWQLNPETAFALDDDPELRLGLGQTSDDLDELAAMRDDPAMHDALWHSLEHLAELLRFLAFADKPRPRQTKKSHSP